MRVHMIASEVLLNAHTKIYSVPTVGVVSTLQLMNLKNYIGIFRSRTSEAKTNHFS